MGLINQRYEPVQLLGEGGFGSVYKVADHFEYRKILALKKIKSSIISKKAINIFKHEFKFLISLVHPNLVKVHDFDFDKDSEELFFTMEFVKGKSLIRSLKESFSWEKVQNNLIQAARALAYIHSKEVIHYDIKPDNIFIDDYGKLKLMDFGFAGSKNTNEVRGTMQFIAPELIMKKDVTHQIDFFSLGVTFYFCITGKLPFRGKDKHEIMTNAIKGNYIPIKELRKDIPRKMIKVITKMMEADPSERYQSADEIIIDLIDDPQKRNSVHYLFTGLGIRSYISSGELIGRKKEVNFLMSNSAKVFQEKVFYDNKPIFLIGRYGNGKSSVLREYKYLIQLNENIDYFRANFVRGDETKYQAFEIIVLEMFRVYKLNFDDYPHLSFLFEDKSGFENFDDTEQAKLQKMEEIEAITEFFCDLSTRYKFVLELKDFDNTNSSSINLFENLTREIRRRPEKQMAFMIVTTVQQENLKSYHKITIKRMRENIHRLNINPLLQDETKEYVHQILSTKNVPEEITGFIHRFTGGVPYYVNELLIYLFNQSYLKRSKMKWELNPAFMTELTVGLRELTYSNFKKFTNIEQSVIKELMILARPTSINYVDIMSKVTMVNEQIFLKFLHKLTDSEIIEKIKYFDGYRYYITKKLFLNSVVKDFPKDQYLKWNEMTAELIEKKFGVNNDNIYALTDYYYRSPKKDKAIKMLERSINKSFEENNLEFAVTNLKRLYGIETDSQKKINIFISIIQNMSVLNNFHSVLDQIVRFEQSEHELSEVANLKIQLTKFQCSFKAGRYDLLEQTRDWLFNFKIKRSFPKEVKASYLVWLGDYYKNEGSYKKALKFLKKAFNIHKKDDRELLKAKTILRISKIKKLQGNLMNVLNDIEYCLNIFERYDETEEILETYLCLGEVYERLLNINNSLEYYTKCNQMAKEQNNIHYEVKSSHRLAEIKMLSLDFAEALELINCGMEKPEDVNIVDLTGDIYYYRALYFYHTAKLDEAVDSINRSIDVRTLLKRNVKLGESFFLKTKILLRMCKFDQAEKIIETLDSYITTDNRSFLIEYNTVCSLFYFHSGKYRKALKYLGKIRRIIDKYSSLEKRISHRIIFALIYNKQNDANNTLQNLGEAYTLYKQNKDLLEHNRMIYIKLMIIYNKVRAYSGAVEEGIKELSGIIQFLGNHELPFYKALANYNLGMIYNDSGESYRAVSCLKSTVKEFRKISTDHPEYKRSEKIILGFENENQEQ